MKICLTVLVSILLFSQIAAGFNQPPLADIQGQREILACGCLILDGSKSFDPDGNIISREWTVERESDRKTWTVTGEKVAIEPPFSDTPGYYRVTLNITDNGGTDVKTDSKTVGFRINPNRAPRIEDIEINDETFFEGEEFTLRAIMDQDSNDDSLIVKWDYSGEIFNFSNPGILNPVAKVIFAPTYGSYETIKVVAKDTCGQSSEKEIKVAVKKTSGSPEVEIIAPDTVNEGISFAVSVSVKKSAKPEDLSYEWRWNKYNETAILGRVNGQSPSLQFDDGGAIIELHLKVVDKKSGASAVKNTTIFVEETQDDPPVADASATARIAVAGENFTLNATGSYDDREYLHGKISKCWEISANFNGVSWKETRPLCARNDTLIYRFNRTGVYTVRLIGRDSSFQESLPRVITINVVTALPAPTPPMPTAAIKKAALPSKTAVKSSTASEMSVNNNAKSQEIMVKAIAILIIFGTVVFLYLIAKKVK